MTVGVLVGVAVFVAVLVGVNVGVLVFVAVDVDVATGVPVEVGVGVFVFVAVDVGVPQAPPKTSENALAVPVSPPARSLTLIVQLPSAFCPSKALSALLGENDPVGKASASPAGPHWPSIAGNPPSSSNVSCARLLLLQPKVDAGTPGRSNASTVVPRGEVIDTATSPTHEWLMPGVVEAGSVDCVPSNLKLRSEIVPTPLTGIVKLTPVVTLSGIATAAPV